MELYNNIEQAIRLHQNLLNVEDNVTESDVRHAIRFVMRDNPDIFWFVHQYHFDKEHGIVTFVYRCSPERRATIQNSIDDVVKNDFQIDYVRTLTLLEQVAYVYKWLLTYCNYNINSAYNQSIDSVFVRRNSVCTGYAKAAQYLFKSLGIDSKLVFGKLHGDAKEDGRHCWNIVFIDGIYYHLDVCVGDVTLEYVLKEAGINNVRHYGDFNYNCFCVSTNEILKTRSIEDIEILPPCDSTLPEGKVEKLSQIDVKQRNGGIGCQLTRIGSSADIYLCIRDKNVVLKKFRGNDIKKCEEEYGYMKDLKGCDHLLQLNKTYSDLSSNILAIEQSAPIVDLFCSHYYHPTLYGVLTMIRDITIGWLECYQRGIIYRDIHICNIYKTNEGRYKLGDFGSCSYKLKDLRERVGNPWFMASETYISGQFDERSAVYSITSVLYFVLNGLRPPFIDGNNEKEALQRKMNGETLPKPALLQSIPNEFSGVVMTNLVSRGCAFYPSDRIQTCKDLIQIIDVLCSALKGHRIELKFVQQDTETILDNKTISDVYIPRDIHHKLASGEDVERVATTAAPTFLYDENDNSTEYGDDLLDLNDLPNEVKTALECEDGIVIDEGSIPMSNDVENYCRTMGIFEAPPNRNVEKNSQKTTPAYRKCINGHMYDSLYGNNCPFCPTQNNEYNDTIWQQHFGTKTLKRDVVNANEGSPSRTFVPCFNRDVKAVNTSKDYCPSPAYPASYSSSPSLIGILAKLFHRKHKTTNQICEVYSSVFAPAEIKRKSHVLIQVYLHLLKETEKVKELASESDKYAERRDYVPLQCKLKNGDTVHILLNIYGESLLLSETENVVWQGSFTKCSFDYFVPMDLDVNELSCVALLSVNGIPVGEMRFITKIVEYAPRKLNPEIISHQYNKVFISYSHQDESKVKFLHKGLELGAIPHFFDRKYLKAGDVYPQVIQDYINSADLFILCWSENASKSEYVQKERSEALKRAFPQVQPEKAAKLRIYPISIEPRTELPDDMKDNYHFGEI